MASTPDKIFWARLLYHDTLMVPAKDNEHMISSTFDPKGLK
jgi:hypothetical protein